MRKVREKRWSEQSTTNSGLLSIIERIVRSHPLLYYISRKLIRFTNIFEEDANGVKEIKFSDKINILDVGASDGIATKFFLKNLKVNKVYCFEPNKNFVKILKNTPFKSKIIINPFALGHKNETVNIFYPEYRIFKQKLKFITLSYYDKLTLEKQISLDFKFKNNIYIVKDKLKIKKFKKIKSKIDLVKIDVNGFEFSVIKSLEKLIKRDKPALLIETNNDIHKITKFLRKLSYNQYIYSNDKKLFKKANKRYTLNTYFLQKKHFNY